MFTADVSSSSSAFYNLLKKGDRIATKYYDNLIFKHLIDMPTSHCIFCSTREPATGKTILFLIFEQNKSVYKREGLRNAWVQITDKEEMEFIRTKFYQAIEERKVPCYSTPSELNFEEYEEYFQE